MTIFAQKPKKTRKYPSKAQNRVLRTISPLALSVYRQGLRRDFCCKHWGFEGSSRGRFGFDALQVSTENKADVGSIPTASSGVTKVTKALLSLLSRCFVN